MATVATPKHQFGGSCRVLPAPAGGAKRGRIMTTMQDSSEATGREGRCPVWCDGHSETLHYTNEFNFEGGARSDDDHGLVLTLVEPYRPEGPWYHGEPAWIPERLNVSLFQKFGAMRPTISFVGPTKPFQLTVEEAVRLRDALDELLGEAHRDLKVWIERR